jgi:hypothetical protein
MVNETLTKTELQAVKNYFSAVGRLGGKSKSLAKLNACRKTLAKARQKRWIKKENEGVK